MFTTADGYFSGLLFADALARDLTNALSHGILFFSRWKRMYVRIYIYAHVQRSSYLAFETRRVEKLNISYTVGERRISRVSRVVTRDWEFGIRRGIGDKMGFFVTMTGASSHVRFEGENRRSRERPVRCLVEGHTVTRGKRDGVYLGVRSLHTGRSKNGNKTEVSRVWHKAIRRSTVYRSKRLSLSFPLPLSRSVFPCAR